MLTMLGNRLVNLDHVQHIEPLPETETTPGSPELRITFDDGETYDAGGDLSELRILCGTILPAPPGYAVAVLDWRVQPEPGMPATYDVLPILAFRYGEGSGEPVPITVDGEVNPTDHFAVILPDGRCRCQGVDHESVEAWKAANEAQAAKLNPASDFVEH